MDDSQWVYPHIYSCVSKVLFSATSLISVSSGSATLEKWAKASGGIKRNVLMCLSRVVGGCFRRVQSPRPSAGYESKQSRSVPRSTQSSPERSTHPLALNCPQMVDSEHKSSVCLKQCWCNSSYRRMLTQSGLPRGRKLICRRERRKPNSLSEEPTCCSFDANIQKTVSKLRSFFKKQIVCLKYENSMKDWKLITQRATRKSGSGFFSAERNIWWMCLNKYI